MKQRSLVNTGDISPEIAYIGELIQKTYQLTNVVNGISHSHKTANIFFSFDSVA